MRAAALTTERIKRFIQDRKAAGKADATVNRETGALRQALNVARKEGRLSRVPYFPMLREDNARQGFFERADFEAVAAKLTEQEQATKKPRRKMAPLADFARFGYLTGWRSGEIKALRWERVDRQGKEIRLATSKNGRGRVLALDGEILDVIERRWKLREYITREGISGLCDYVFHRQGRPVADFRKRWEKACEDAKLPGWLFHDFRRTAARDMVRAGTPETVAMSITGHLTRSVFDRYNITDGEDQRQAQRRTAEYRAAQPAERNVTPLRQEGGQS